MLQTLLLLAALPGPAVGDPAQPAVAAPAASARTPIREFDLRTLESLGREIYRQDVAAARATDALKARVSDLAPEHIVGWVVDPAPSTRVRFLRDLGKGPEAAYDIDVPAGGGPVVSAPTDRTLTAEERTMFAARKTAASHAGPVCRPGYNVAVTRDPAGDGWLVWLLAPSPAAGAIPVGGHYRFTLSADGETVIRRDALFVSCLVVNGRQDAPPGSQPVATVATHVVSPTPVETHVFLQLLYRTPLFVLAGGRVWKIEGGRISDAGPFPK